MPYNIIEYIAIVLNAVDTVFNAVYNLREIAELADCPYIPVQMVALVYMVISKLPIFRSDIRRWLHRTPVDQTWLDLQHVFTEAHPELREMEASVDEIRCQQANAIVS